MPKFKDGIEVTDVDKITAWIKWSNTTFDNTSHWAAWRPHLTDGIVPKGIFCYTEVRVAGMVCWQMLGTFANF